MTTTNLFFKKRVIHSEGKNLNSKSDSLDWVWQLAAMSSWGLRCVGLGILWMGVGQLMGQDSTWTEYRYAEGVVSSEGYMVDGQPAGYWRSFYPDANWTWLQVATPNPTNQTLNSGFYPHYVLLFF